MLGSMRHVSSRWCRFSSGLRAGANFGRSPAHAYAQECQAQATSSENSKGRLPDRDVRPMKRYSTLAGGRAVMRSRAAVAATTKILTSGLTKIKLTLATAVQGCFFPRSVTQNVNLFTRSESTVSAMDTTGVRHSVCSDSSTHHNTGTQIQHLPHIKHTSLSPRSHRRPPNQPHYVNYEIITDKPPRSPIGGLNTPPRSSHLRCLSRPS